MRMMICNDRDRLEFIHRINQVELKERSFVAEFKMFRKVRSLRSNRLYFMWLNCVKDETGQDTEDLHIYFKQKYLPWSTSEVFGDEIRRVTSTKNLDSKQFSEYLEKIRMEMQAQAIYLPQPGEKEFDAFYAHYGLK